MMDRAKWAARKTWVLYVRKRLPRAHVSVATPHVVKRDGRNDADVWTWYITKEYTCPVVLIGLGRDLLFRDAWVVPGPLKPFRYSAVAEPNRIRRGRFEKFRCATLDELDQRLREMAEAK